MEEFKYGAFTQCNEFALLAYDRISHRTLHNNPSNLHLSYNMLLLVHFVPEVTCIQGAGGVIESAF